MRVAEGGRGVGAGWGAGVARRLPEVYAAVALFVALSLSVLTPPFFVPDEAAHSLRALELAHGELLSERTAQGVGARVDAGAVEAMNDAGALQGSLQARYPLARDRPDGRVTEAQLAPMREVRWLHRTVFAAFLNTAVYPPLFYLPQAAGWRIGEAAGWTIVHSLVLARMLAALAAIGLGWLAGCIGARSPYLPLVLVLLLPVMNLRGVSRGMWIAPGVAMLLVLAVCGGWQLIVHPLGTFAGPQAQPGAQLAWIHRHPASAAVHIVVGTLREAPGLAIKGLEALGSADVFPPVWVYVLLLAGVTGILACSGVRGVANWRARALLLVSLALVCGGMSLAEYIIWTPSGVSRVLGLQSRYYLPLVPFALMLLGRWRTRSSQRSSRGRLLAVSAAVFTVAVLYTPWVAARSYYRLPPWTAAADALRSGSARAADAGGRMPH